MSLDAKSRVVAPFAPALDLPPPFRAVALREVGDAFAHAKLIAADAGAGTLVHVGRFDLAEFAVVLEPEEPLCTARRALYAGLAALADALAACAPPEKPISFDWPDAIRIDGGLVGGARPVHRKNSQGQCQRGVGAGGGTRSGGGSARFPCAAHNPSIRAKRAVVSRR